MILAIKLGYQMKQIMKYVYSKTGSKMSSGQSDVIARTETQALQNKSREWSYKKIDPEGKLKYKWLNPVDDRTTDVCRNIVRRTNKGVTMNQLKQIIKDEGKKGGHDPRELTPHVNCRSTFVRSRS